MPTTQKPKQPKATQKTGGKSPIVRAKAQAKTSAKVGGNPPPPKRRLCIRKEGNDVQCTVKTDDDQDININRLCFDEFIKLIDNEIKDKNNGIQMIKSNTTTIPTEESMPILQEYNNDVECLLKHINGRKKQLSDKIEEMSNKIGEMNNLKSKIENTKQTKPNNVGKAMNTSDTYNLTKTNPPRRLPPLQIQPTNHQSLNKTTNKTTKPSQTLAEQFDYVPPKRPKSKSGTGPNIPTTLPLGGSKVSRKTTRKRQT